VPRKPFNQYKYLYDKFRPAQYRPHPYIKKINNKFSCNTCLTITMTNNRNNNNNNSLYANILKNGTQKGGSMHEPKSINEKSDNMIKSIDSFNKKFIKLTGNINELTKRMDDLK